MAKFQPQGPRVFQIGFNKCATNALYKLFDGSGVKSLHWCGRRYRKRFDPEIVGRNPQAEIAKNIRKGRPPVAGFDSFTAFFDLEYSTQDVEIENFRAFREMDAAYPDALFILNTRDKGAWIRSRARHADGRYVEKWMKRLGTDEPGVYEHWSRDFDDHHKAVKTHFGHSPHRLLVFDIDQNTPQQIADWVAPWYTLDTGKWKQLYVTDVLAEKRGWADTRADLRIN